MAGKENENEASGSGCNGCASESCSSGQPKKGTVSYHLLDVPLTINHARLHMGELTLFDTLYLLLGVALCVDGF